MIRAALLAAALTLTGGVAAAQPAPKAAVEAKKPIPAAKLFRFLDKYLELPAAQRDRFALAYRLRRADKQPLRQITLVDGGQRIALPVAADGRVERLPTLAQLKTGTLELGLPETVKLSLNLGIVATLPRSAEYAAADLAAALAQASTGSKKAAGLIGFAIPKFEAVGFAGASSGTAVLADGRSVALPLDDGEPYFAPSRLPTARTIKLDKPATRLPIGPAPKVKKG